VVHLPTSPTWSGRRAKRRPLLLYVGFACAAAVVLEVAAVTNFFGLAGHPASSSPGGPDLNPFHERILVITTNVTYLGAGHGYFPALQGANVCGIACPELPFSWPSDGILPAQIGVYFYYNVTNIGSDIVNLSVPIITTSGGVSTLFVLQTYCCYTTAEPPYDEAVDSSVNFSPGTTFGFRGYAYTTVSLPQVAAGGFTLYINFTSD
jgi:hypothetical protein